jgi:hypothetical protein
LTASRTWPDPAEPGDVIGHHVIDRAMSRSHRLLRGVIYASSFDVARDFGQRHDHVLRDYEITRQNISPNLERSWFRPEWYFDRYGRRQRCIDLRKHRLKSEPILSQRPLLAARLRKTSCDIDRWSGKNRRNINARSLPK